MFDLEQMSAILVVLPGEERKTQQARGAVGDANAEIDYDYEV